MPRVVKPKTYRHICDLDTAALGEKVAAIPEEIWNVEDSQKQNRFACFHHTRHIIARFTPLNRSPREFYATQVWSDWESELRPVLDAVARRYNFALAEFPKIMFARLAAGGAIDPHIDQAGSNFLTHKIHVPLITNSKVWFEVGRERFQLPAGHAYELNNVRRHAVRNDGLSDRIHLIFEMFDNVHEAQPLSAIEERPVQVQRP